MTALKKIFVVDDNLTSLNICKDILKPYYDAYTIPSAAKLFEVLERLVPDLILLDVAMPETDGYETARFLKSKPQYKDIPIIFVTTRDDEESELKGFTLGAIDYVIKPISAPLLLKRIETHLSVHELKNSLAATVARLENAVGAFDAVQVTMSAMFEASPHANILFDDKFNLADCNPVALKFFGYKTKEALFAGFLKSVTESIPAFQPDGRASIPLSERLVSAVKNGACKFETEMFVSGAKRNLSVEFKRIPYKNSFAVVGYVLDVSEMYERAAELAAAYEKNELQITKLNAVVKATKIGVWDITIIDNDPVNPKNVFSWSD